MYIGCIGIIGGEYGIAYGMYGIGGGGPCVMDGCPTDAVLGAYPSSRRPKDSYDACERSSLYSLAERLRAT